MYCLDNVEQIHSFIESSVFFTRLYRTLTFNWRYKYIYICKVLSRTDRECSIEDEILN